jgi:hypothetical protein
MANPPVALMSLHPFETARQFGFVMVTQAQ